MPLSARLGRNFWTWYAFYEESECWSQEQMAAYQISTLQHLLTELKGSSPYYRDLLLGVDPASIDSVQRFQQFVPTQTQTDFSSQFERIVAQNLDRRVEHSSTSGTTGKAMQFYHPYRDGEREWASVCHQWKRVGYIPGQSRRVEFRGLLSKGSLVEEFPHRNMIRCSILHLGHEHIRVYAEVIRRNKINFIHGYPSAVALLADGIKTSGINFPQPEAILLASEMVLDWQQQRIRAAFPEARIFAHYGCAQRTVIAGWCEYRQEYHVLPLYGLTEVDPETGELIATNLHNTVNGFVRFRMGDAALEWSAEPCPDCGRPYLLRIKELAGRLEDYLYAPERGWIPSAIMTFPLKSLRAVGEIQFVQKEQDEIVIRYILKSQSQEAEAAAELQIAVEKFQEMFGREMNLSLQRVDSFERGATGKWKWIVSELDRWNYLRERRE